MIQEKDENIVITYRPDGKKGVIITKAHYEMLSTFILATLDEQAELTLHDLLDKANMELADSIDSDVAWFLLQVKLDLEARDYIRTVVAPYNKRIYLLRITRTGQRKVRSERSLQTDNV